MAAPLKNATRSTITTTMATPQQQEALHREGRLILALQAHKLGQIKTLEAAAKLYDMPPTTARRRAAGV